MIYFTTSKAYQLACCSPVFFPNRPHYNTKILWGKYQRQGSNRLTDTLWNPEDLTWAWHCGFCFVSAFDLNHPVLLLHFSPPEMPHKMSEHIRIHICHGGAHRKDSNFLNTQFEPQMMPQLGTNRIAFRTLRLKLKETQQVKCEPWISWDLIPWKRMVESFWKQVWPDGWLVGWCYWGAMVMFVLEFSMKGP